MFRKLLSPPVLTSQVSIAILILRIGFAGFLLTHGYGKMQSLLDGDHDFPDPLHVSPIVSQIMAVFSEFFCSLLLMVGLLSRPVAAILVVCMAVIAFVVHGPDPLGDKEHALLFLIAFVVILLTGPGKYSLDARIFK